VERANTLRREVKINVVGKYVKLKDAYKSLNEAFTHAGVTNRVKVKSLWIEAEEVEKDPEGYLSGAQGILIPGGFGERGIEGKIRAAQYAREKKVPFLGICLGMQCAVIDFACNVAGLKGADSTEFNPHTPYPVIDLLPEQKKIKDKGGTMRLGSYPCKLKKNSLSFQAYGKEVVYERHRHRYEFNNQYREILVKRGLRIAGIFPERDLVEIIEIPGHPWFVGTQFHPEFQSRILSSHPLFRDFIKAAMNTGDFSRPYSTQP
jgi:CTP synthase